MNLLINTKDIKSGKLLNLLPEFYELKNTIENSADGWHVKESVFDHTLLVLTALDKIFEDDKNLETIFNAKIDIYTRKNLLEIAALFHDIGKKEAMVIKNGFSGCPGHEIISVNKTKEILRRFDLSQKESELVLGIITNHSVFHKLLMPDNQNFDKNLEDLKKSFGGSIYLDLLLLSYADTANSKLQIINPKEFNDRIGFYQKEIQNLIK